jgi:hypothetical protein
MVRNAPLVHLATFAVIGAAIAFAPGCVGRGYVVADTGYTTDYEYQGSYPDEIVVYGRPPRPRFEVVLGPAPGPGYAWVPGYWDWQDRWVWVGGRWDAARPGYVWTPPVARVNGGRVVYLHGFWRPESRPLPRIYVQPHIAVTARVQAQPGVSYGYGYEGRVPLATRPLPPGHAMQEERGLPPGRAMQEERGLPPGRAMQEERGLPPGRAMQEERRGPYATPAPMPPRPMPPGQMREHGPMAQPMPPGRVEERGPIAQPNAPVYRPMPPAPGPERRVEVGPERPPDVAPPSQGRGRPRPMGPPMGPPGGENRGHGRGPR